MNRIFLFRKYPNKKDIQAAFIGTFIPEMFIHQGHTAPMLLDFAGLKEESTSLAERHYFVHRLHGGIRNLRGSGQKHEMIEPQNVEVLTQSG